MLRCEHSNEYILCADNVEVKYVMATETQALLRGESLRLDIKNSASVAMRPQSRWGGAIGSQLSDAPNGNFTRSGPRGPA